MSLFVFHAGITVALGAIVPELPPLVERVHYQTAGWNVRWVMQIACITVPGKRNQVKLMNEFGHATGLIRRRRDSSSHHRTCFNLHEQL